MVYAATTGVILYWNLDQTFVIRIYHHVWFDEYNSCLSIEDKHTPCYLPFQQDPEIPIHNSDLLNFIPCEIDITSTTFINSEVLTYKIELPPSGKKLGFNLLDDEDSTIPYVASFTMLDDEDFTIPFFTDTILSSPAGQQLPTQD